MKKIVWGIIGILVLAVIGTGVFYYMNTKPVEAGNKTEKLVTIEPGSGVQTIAKKLKDENIIRNEFVFTLYSRLKGLNLQAGEYRFTSDTSMQEVAGDLAAGRVNTKVELKITIPEGSNIVTIAEIISKATGKDKEEVLKALNSKDFVRELIVAKPEVFTNEMLQKDIKYPLEGYLFPATYSYLKSDVSVEQIIAPMLSHTIKAMEKYKTEREAKGLTVHELLTMSSLIEEEATAKTDRDLISSVFYNRLDINMPLQTDPTVLYALGAHKDRVYYKDLKVQDPYNTYQNRGLTPGPIANAGVSSIIAALNPAQSEYIYFLATPEGEVLFSKTLDEHNRKKAEHIK